MKTKGGILNGTENMGSKELQEKTVILQKWTGKKKWEANRCQKRNRHLEGDGKNGKQIEKKNGGILNGTEKPGRKELEVKNGHLTNMDWEEKMGST